MTLPRFLQASYALMAEEHQRINPLVDLLSIAEKINPATAKLEKVPSEREVKQQNEDAMAALKARMASVAGISPQKKPRRA